MYNPFLLGQNTKKFYPAPTQRLYRPAPRRPFHYSVYDLLQHHRPGYLIGRFASELRRRCLIFFFSHLSLTSSLCSLLSVNSFLFTHSAGNPSTAPPEEKMAKEGSIQRKAA
ncbi:hypothetical protein L484_018891 [Morus notabilis]|uniref:Uncharacterized protein n=1 Tax=Morus notabilis TaxID=981085 RepID=W9QSA5_9ROSA|nr:hypothetical protein L484_018891 [Morus notabilis]